MNTILRGYKNRLSLLHLDGNAPASVSAVAGTVVACLHGKLWITQSGEREDFVVDSGYRYLSRSAGLIVVNAINGPSTALVYWLAPKQTGTFAPHPVCLDPEGTARLVQDAHRLRHQAIGDLIRRLATRLSRVVRSMAARVRVDCIFRGQRKYPVSIDETTMKTALSKVRLEHYHAKTHL